MPAEPEISVIVPAWNEANELPRTLPVLQRALDELGLAAEIVVVDNASTDGTAEIARAHGPHLVLEPERHIARVRNAVAAAARGRSLIFVDADTRPSAELLRVTLSLLDSGSVCGGGARIVFETPDRILYRWGTVFWNAIALRLNLAAGCYVFATREAFAATGGFSEHVYAGEDARFAVDIQPANPAGSIQMLTVSDLAAAHRAAAAEEKRRSLSVKRTFGRPGVLFGHRYILNGCNGTATDEFSRTCLSERHRRLARPRLLRMIL